MNHKKILKKILSDIIVDTLFDVPKYVCVKFKGTILKVKNMKM